MSNEKSGNAKKKKDKTMHDKEEKESWFTSIHPITDKGDSQTLLSNENDEDDKERIKLRYESVHKG
jgi:hypothetical protein